MARTATKAAARKSAARKSAARKSAARPAKRAGAGAPIRHAARVRTGLENAAAARAAATVTTTAQLQKVKDDLEVVSLKLLQVDPEELSAADRRKWTDEIDAVDLAISRARNAVLRQLVEAFEAEIGDIQEATGKLAKALERLNRAAQIIEAVASVLGIIERVITLGR
jgi:hypothetical protein